MAKASLILASQFKIEISEEKITAMFHLLQDLSAEELHRAIKIFCMKHKDLYPGTNIVAYLREYASYNPQEKSPEEAWLEVQNEMRRVGGVYGKPQFKEDTLARTVDHVGWRKLCTSENLEMDRQYFSKVYKQILERKKLNQIYQVASQ